MMEGHSQVGQNAVDMLYAVVSHEIRDITEVGMYKCKSGVGRCIGERVGVAVEPEQSSLASKRGENRRGVTAATECSVHVNSRFPDV